MIDPKLQPKYALKRGPLAIIEIQQTTSSFSSSQISKYFFMTAKRGALIRRSSLSLWISASCKARSSSVCSSVSYQTKDVEGHSAYSPSINGANDPRSSSPRISSSHKCSISARALDTNIDKLSRLSSSIRSSSVSY